MTNGSFKGEATKEEIQLSASMMWLIAIGLSLGPAVSNGFARFAYGLVLPAMRADLDWSYVEAGWLNTANAIGYLIGALLSLVLISSFGARRLFVWGMALTALSLVLSGLTRDFWLLSTWRVLAGIAGAPVFVAGGTLAAALFKGDTAKNALAIAIYFGGGGLGQLISGASTPLILERMGHEIWPETWLLLGIASAIAFVPAYLAANVLRTEGTKVTESKADPLPYGRMMPALSGYFLFGLGYLIYLTFLVAWMRDEGASASLVAVVWSLMGIGTMMSPFVWRRVLAWSRGGEAMAASNLTTGVGVLCALVIAPPSGVIISACLVGASLYIVPTAATTFGRKNLSQAQWGRSFAVFTTVFSIGQMIGPVAAGVLADATSTIAPGLICASIILVFGAFIAVIQRPLRA
ncbi:MAG: YbfB/YjiJ family MFS transporter [Pseudomonadota bacterium]